MQKACTNCAHYQPGYFEKSRYIKGRCRCTGKDEAVSGRKTCVMYRESEPGTDTGNQPATGRNP
ncbi:MAG: hypothetical protein K6T65_07865 [Peptococcaceae bacterium]|nr:hypothetical protein [Peptococcaceae bacterium]